MNQTTGVENNLRHEMIQGETKEEKKKKLMNKWWSEKVEWRSSMNHKMEMIQWSTSTSEFTKVQFLRESSHLFSTTFHRCLGLNNSLDRVSEMPLMFFKVLVCTVEQEVHQALALDSL